MAKNGNKKRGASAKNLIDVALEGKDAFQAVEERVALRVHVGARCPRGLALELKRLLVAERAGGVIDVVPAAASVSSEPVDAALLLVGDSDMRALALAYARQGVPVAFVAEGALDVPDLDLPDELRGYVGVVSAATPDALAKKLSSWLVSSTDKGIPLAANFAFCRKAVADELIGQVAVDNAVVGAVSLIPGSDLPIMCTAQAKLALDLAAAHGRGLDAYRALEVAAVVAAGFGWRALARTLASFVPGVGLVVKSAIGFGGTVAAGRAVQFLFDVEDGKVDMGALVSKAKAKVAAAPPDAALLTAAPVAGSGYVTY